jgi:acetyl esterase/lipase
MRRATLVALGALALFAPRAGAQGATDSVATLIENSYAVTPNIVYRTVGGVDLKLDVYQPRRATGPVPTVLYFFGGGWVTGSRERAVMRLLPWLAKGWAVINVDYRLAKSALAPAAVEDARCALFWTGANAATYRFDLTRLVTAGHSAGAHLALMTAMAPRGAGFDRECAAYAELPTVAAVMNWYGPTVVRATEEGPAAQNFTTRWLGNQPDREGIARRVSPLTWVRAGGPAVITIHGDADDTVPYESATQLRTALDRAGVPHRLITIPAGGHGQWPIREWIRAEQEVDRFLGSRGLAVPDSLARVIFQR